MKCGVIFPEFIDRIRLYQSSIESLVVGAIGGNKVIGKGRRRIDKNNRNWVPTWAGQGFFVFQGRKEIAGISIT